MKIDESLGKIGECGRYQKWVMFLLVFPCIIIGGYCMVLISVLYTPKHRCKLPGYPNDTFTIQSAYHRDLINRTIPWIADTSSYDRCNMYAIPETGISRQLNASLVSCDEWVFDESVFSNTFSSENNYVCDNKFKGSHIKMIFYFGLLVGDFALGVVSDSFGRKIGIFLGLMLTLVCGVAVTWAPEFYSFSLLQFIIGGGAHGAFVCIAVIETEIVGPAYRMYPGMMIQGFFALGVCYVALSGYLARNWMWLNLSLALPCVAFISYWWLIAETPRWLLSKGRREEGIEILRKTAKINKAQNIDEDVFHIEIDHEGADGRLWDIFKAPVLMRRALILSFAWLVVSMTYYGVTMNAENLAGDFHLNFFLMGLAEIAGTLVGLAIVNRLGRRWSNAGTLVVAGVACLITVPCTLFGTNNSAQTFIVLLSLLGKASVTAAFGVVYIFTAEILPTVIRNAAMGTCSCAARLGSMIAPYIAKYGDMIGGKFGPVVPLVVFGILSVIAGFLILFLPETLDQKLPDTMEEGERFGRPPKLPSQNQRDDSDA